MLLAVTIPLALVLLGLTAALVWRVRHGRRYQGAFMELAHSLLPMLEEAGPFRRKTRALLMSSPLYTHALDGLRGSKGERRIKALQALTKLDGAEVVRPLLSQLEAEEEEVREEAVAGLASLRDGRALELLLSLWSDYPLELVAEALVRHGATITPKVGPLVTHGDPIIRFWAVEVLKRLKVPEAAPFLADALRDPQVAVRANAARALGEVGTEEVRPLVSLLRYDPAPEVRLQAGESLVRLGGKEGEIALQEAFLQLGEEYLPWDAAVQLWRTYVSHLQRVDGLLPCLGRASALKGERLRRWLQIGVAARDVPTLTLSLQCSSEAWSRQVAEALERAVVMHGEEAILQDLVQQLSLPGMGQVAALRALEGLPLSYSSVARLSAELSPLLQAPDQEVRSRAAGLLRRWEHRLPNPMEAMQRLQVFLADECGPFRQGVRLMLELDGVEVVGEATTADEAQDMLPQLPPGVAILCSTSLPGYGSFQEWLREERPSSAVIFVRDGPDGDGRIPPLGTTAAPSITRAVTSEMVLNTLHSLANGADSEEEVEIPAHRLQRGGGDGNGHFGNGLGRNGVAGKRGSRQWAASS